MDAGVSTASGITGASTKLRITARIDATTAKAIAWTASPVTIDAVVAPVALKTAKSRVRSCALRYSTDPITSAAMIHSTVRTMAMVDLAELSGSRALSIASSDETVRSAGRSPGSPSINTTDTRSWPAKAISCTTRRSRYTLGTPANIDESTRPTTRKRRSPSRN